ncbi:MAG: class II fructose-1,6-bisphosphate aldolase [Planctomycetota bacterium]|nr:class II fructose-1,6-bisphosphate aldolase [Planctomycetota bacterium]
MGLVSGKEILQKANKGGYAVGAFNFVNMEVLDAILSAAQDENAPVIVAASEGAIKYAGFETIVALATTGAAARKIPIALHLDHGKDMKLIEKCIKGGFTSVMIDASHAPFNENVETTKKVVEMARPKGISVEAELGRLTGVEDHVSVAERDAVLVNPAEAESFAKQTGIDSLAPAIGTSHGAFKFKGEAKLDIERLAKVKKATQLPLVLHGASSLPEEIVGLVAKFGGKLDGAHGVPDSELQKTIAGGINKVNVDTDLRLAFLGGLRRVLLEQKEEIDLRKVLGPAKEMVYKAVRSRIKVLGCSGKA